ARVRHRRVASLEADVRDLPFRDASFDVVVSTSTLDHFAARGDIERSLVEIRRVLRPPGRLILTLDNPLHPLLALRSVAPFFWHRLGLVPYKVGVTLGSRRLRAALERTGFRVLELDAVMHFPRVLGEIASALVRQSAAMRSPRVLSTLMRFERLAGW